MTEGRNALHLRSTSTRGRHKLLRFRHRRGRSACVRRVRLLRGGGGRSAEGEAVRAAADGAPAASGPLPVLGSRFGPGGAAAAFLLVLLHRRLQNFSMTLKTY